MSKIPEIKRKIYRTNDGERKQNDSEAKKAVFTYQNDFFIIFDGKLIH